MKNVMIDLETMDTAPTAAIMTIGAVQFDNNDIIDEYYAIIDLQSSVDWGLTMSPSTVKWWINQPNKSNTFDDSKSDLLPAVLRGFASWLPKDCRVWGNGSDFDNVILRNAYEACSIPLPWKYYNNACYRTIKNLQNIVQLDRLGAHHNALDDAKSQALHLIRIVDVLGIKL